jgi:hypothetical protein
VDKMKQWIGLTVAGVLVVGVVGWMFLISPKKSEATDLRTQATAAENKNRELETRVATLKALSKQEPRFRKEREEARASIPDNPALPALIRALTVAAEKADVELISMAPAAPAPFQKATSAAPVAAAPTGAAKPAVTAGGTPAASAGAGLQVIVLTLQVGGDFFSTEKFFNQVEQMTRAFKVTGFTIGTVKETVQGGGSAPAGPGRANDSETGEYQRTSITASVYMSPPAASGPTPPVVAAPVK